MKGYIMLDKYMLELKQKLTKLDIDNKTKEKIMKYADSSGRGVYKYGGNHGIAILRDDNLYYVQRVPDKEYDIIMDKIFGPNGYKVSQEEAEEIMLRYVEPKFSNPKIHIFNTELTEGPECFVGYSWPLVAVAEKLQPRDMGFHYMLG